MRNNILIRIHRRSAILPLIINRYKKGIIMKIPVFLTLLFIITFIGTSLQAQINTKVNLRFEDKVQGW
jgi:hypothetical protein